MDTRNTLHRHDSASRFARDPKATLAQLHEAAVGESGDSRDLLALAELSFAHATATGDRRYYLAAAVYAYAYLFPGSAAEAPGRFELGTRLAADLYNRGITEAMESVDAAPVTFTSGVYEASFGPVEIEVDRSGFVWGNRELVRFVPVADLEVRGLRSRYRQQGIGAPVAAETEPVAGAGGPQLLSSKARLAATALLRIEEPRAQLAAGRVRATIELYPAFAASEVSIDGRTVPLEVERTATLAFELSDTPIWRREIRGFFGRPPDHMELPTLLSLEPYRHGMIPVVFVHGTASSPGRWAEMVNELLADPAIRRRYFFLFFFYDTGNPIVYSAMHLREVLDAAADAADPAGSDPCVRDAVVIGHSQGGLLTKMTAIDAGTRFWDNVSKRPIYELNLDPEVRDLLERALFVEPVPAVRRIVYVATPHRGSFMASRRGSRLVTRLVEFPGELLDVLSAGRDLDQAALNVQASRMSTSVDDMTPGSPFSRTLDSIPVVDGVAVNSIVAVRGAGPAEEGNDGLVTFASAHVADAESELVVRASHSCQGEPQVIAEVRRILLEHLQRSDCAGPSPLGSN